MKIFKYKNKKYNICNIDYTFHNGESGTHEVLFKGNIDTFNSTIQSQFKIDKMAEFKVLLDSKKVVTGWLIDREVEKYNLRA